MSITPVFTQLFTLYHQSFLNIVIHLSLGSLIHLHIFKSTLSLVICYKIISDFLNPQIFPSLLRGTQFGQIEYWNDNHISLSSLSIVSLWIKGWSSYWTPFLKLYILSLKSYYVKVLALLSLFETLTNIHDEIRFQIREIFLISFHMVSILQVFTFSYHILIIQKHTT